MAKYILDWGFFSPLEICNTSSSWRKYLLNIYLTLRTKQSSNSPWKSYLLHIEMKCLEGVLICTLKKTNPLYFWWAKTAENTQPYLFFTLQIMCQILLIYPGCMNASLKLFCLIANGDLRKSGVTSSKLQKKNKIKNNTCKLCCQLTVRLPVWNEYMCVCVCQ